MWLTFNISAFEGVEAKRKFLLLHSPGNPLPSSYHNISITSSFIWCKYSQWLITIKPCGIKLMCRPHSLVWHTIPWSWSPPWSDSILYTKETFNSRRLFYLSGGSSSSGGNWKMVHDGCTLSSFCSSGKLHQRAIMWCWYPSRNFLDLESFWWTWNWPYETHYVIIYLCNRKTLSNPWIWLVPN